MIGGEVQSSGPGLERVLDQVDRNLTRAVHHTGALLQTTVRANASSATHPDRASYRRGHIPGTGPGPNVFTGDYRRSITHTPGMDGLNPVSVVSTNAPQARRLEYGFADTDALGRVFRQPPYPHWRPAVETIRPVLEQAARDAIQEALR